jgi:hypothetical protein
MKESLSGVFKERLERISVDPKPDVCGMVQNAKTLHP